jgi:hypothetical protein
LIAPVFNFGNIKFAILQFLNSPDSKSGRNAHFKLLKQPIDYTFGMKIQFAEKYD